MKQQGKQSACTHILVGVYSPVMDNNQINTIVYLQIMLSVLKKNKAKYGVLTESGKDMLI